MNLMQVGDKYVFKGFSSLMKGALLVDIFIAGVIYGSPGSMNQLGGLLMMGIDLAVAAFMQKINVLEDPTC